MHTVTQHILKQMMIQRVYLKKNIGMYLLFFFCSAQCCFITLVTFALTLNSSQGTTVSLATIIMNDAADRLPPLRN